ncbi:hypothetical protein SAMN05216241_101267 [Limimonas halophila]|uniref:Uncharacterized protein n=1 Tax=Limimonas halophila TaxID=1082479 RepID=A0A1G7LJA1_9PROT|nr:hypothetical protein [Limimonas halophila]SDF49434.1 hypothetical protein SAMN05216241_101267 [Limimonas halophila]
MPVSRLHRLLLASTVAAITVATAGPAVAGEADVVNAAAEQRGDGTWRFSATVRHADAGWDHYADRWQVLAPDGTVLATRTLHHPHTNEQPFTRSLSGVEIPEGVDTVTIRARDSVHGHGGETVTVELR